MAFADPQSVTIGSAISLPRTSFGSNSGAFQSADGLTKLSIAHTYGASRTRRLIRLDNAVIAADPLLAGVNVKAAMSVYLVVDAPVTGLDVTAQKVRVDAFTAYLTASSGAKVAQLLGGED
jgi:hypothetical protein